MEEDGVPFNGVSQYYEIQLVVRLCDFKRAKDLYLAYKVKIRKCQHLWMVRALTTSLFGFSLVVAFLVCLQELMYTSAYKKFISVDC